MLQTAQKLQTIILDKTGTITHGKPVLTDVLVTGAQREDELLRLVGAVEKSSEHPLAAAIVEGATARGLALPGVDAFNAIPGHGIEARVESHEVLVGNAKLMRDRKVAAGELEGHASRLADEGKTPMYVGIDGGAAGIVAVADTVKEDSKEAPDGARRVRVRLPDGHVPRAVDRGAMRTEAPKSAMCREERRGRWGATQCRRSARQEGTEMKIRWIPIATMAMGLTLAPAIVGAQMPPGGGMGPGMRGGMGMGDIMQMRGMMQQMQGMMQNMADLLKSGTMSPDQMKRMGELMEQMTAHMGQAHDMMGGMGPGEREPRAMHEQMARMQQHMADMQKHMAEMMGGPPSGSPPASPGKK